MRNEITKEITNSFLNYLRVFSWLEIEIRKHFTGRQFSFTSVENFWQMIFNEELSHGDVIKFKEGFLTDWIPKVAGQVWKTFDSTLPPNVITIEDIKQGKEFSSSGIMENNQSRPLGVIRLPFNEKSKNFTLLSLTSFDCWSVDLAIPVMVSKGVYDTFIRARKNKQAVEGDIEAILEMTNYPFDNSFIATLGSSINPEFLNQFTSPLSLPRVSLRLSSPLNAKFRTHNSHPPGTVWALTKTEQPYTIVPHPEKRFEVIHQPQTWFGLEQAHIELSRVENIEYYCKAFQEGHAHPKELFPNARLIEDPHRKVSVLTEFDAHKRHFANSIPIEKEPWRNETHKSTISSVFKDLEHTATE